MKIARELASLVTHLILRLLLFKISFNKQKKTKIRHINDNHIKFEVSLHLGGIWPTVRRYPPRLHRYRHRHPPRVGGAVAAIRFGPNQNDLMFSIIFSEVIGVTYAVGYCSSVLY
jgi:hypothetical protein